MQETTKLKLKKPGTNDYVNIDDLNANMDIVEQFLSTWKEFKEAGGTIGGDINVPGIGSVKAELNKRAVQEIGQWSPLFAYAAGGDMITDSTGSYYVREGNVVTCYFSAITTGNSLKADVILIRNLPYIIDKRWEEVGIVHDFSGLTSDTSGLTIIRHNINSTLVVLGYMATNGRSMGQLWGNMLATTFSIKGQITYRIG